jgi:isopenicillin N synthase-like dioxygenase
MSGLSARQISIDAIDMPYGSLPIVDFSGLLSPRREDREAVVQTIRTACLDKGFFYLANHGISDRLIDEMFTQAKAFFDLPLEDKMALEMSKSWGRSNRGYSPLQGQTLEKGAPPDLKESFYIGVELPMDDPRVVAKKGNHGPNLWPQGLPNFRATMDAYFAEMVRVENTLWRGIARSLDLEESYFEEYCRDSTATLRLLHYPPQPAVAQPGEKGCGAHTDFGGITILLQDMNGGLQIWDEQHGWMHVKPIPSTFVINLGDLIARWTNDRYRSTLHRVVNTSGKERYSIPFFYPGNPDYRVACLPTCHVANQPDKYPPTTVAEHLAEMLRRSYVQ